MYLKLMEQNPENLSEPLSVRVFGPVRSVNVELMSIQEYRSGAAIMTVVPQQGPDRQLNVAGQVARLDGKRYAQFELLAEAPAGVEVESPEKLPQVGMMRAARAVNKAEA